MTCPVCDLPMSDHGSVYDPEGPGETVCPDFVRDMHEPEQPDSCAGDF